MSNDVIDVTPEKKGSQPLPSFDEVKAAVAEKMEVVTNPKNNRERLVMRQSDTDKIRKKFGVDLKAYKHGQQVDTLIANASGECVLERLETKLEDAKKSNMPVDERRQLRAEGKVGMGVGTLRHVAIAYRKRTDSKGEEVETHGRLYSKMAKPFKGLPEDLVNSHSDKIKKLTS